MEWILVRRDLHLPVGTELIKVKARQLIKPYNSEFKASSGWLHKFMMRHGLSLRSRTSISQKLPAQLERKLESFLNHVRLFRKQQEYPLDLIIIMDKTPMYFNMVPERTVTSKGSKRGQNSVIRSREKETHSCPNLDWGHRRFYIRAL